MLDSDLNRKLIKVVQDILNQEGKKNSFLMLSLSHSPLLLSPKVIMMDQKNQKDRHLK
jgi:hypothetical protein